MADIAFLGTGLLGSAFVEAASRRGDDAITVWNRSREKALALEQFGVAVAPSPAEAVIGVSRIHLVLKDDAVVDEVIASMRSGMDDDAIIVDHTTTQPKLTAARAKRLAADGVRYIHCPVFIGPAAARESKGTILAAGPRKLFDVIKPALDRMAERVEYFGERPDLAAVYKLCGNAFIIGLNSVVADMFAVAKGADVSASESLKLLDFFNVASIVANRGRNMATGNYAPSFELTMARKDVRLMLETAGSIPMGTLPGIAKRMDELIANGRGADDLAVIASESI